MRDYPTPDQTTLDLLDHELHSRGLYRYATGLDDLNPRILLDILAAYRWRADWALWCNVELHESLIARNQSRDASSDSMGYWDELLACPILVLEALPAYDSTNVLCRRISGALSGRLSVVDKVTIVLSDAGTLRNYPAHRRYLTFETLFEPGL